MVDQASESAQGTAGPLGQSAPIPGDALIIVPVRNAVLFPEQVMPITVGRPKSIAAAQQAMREQRPVGILMQREQNVADPVPIDMHRFGTVANVVRFLTAPDGTHHLVCQGEQRFQVEEFLSGWPFLVARVVRIPEPAARSPEIEARFLNLQRQAIEAVDASLIYLPPYSPDLNPIEQFFSKLKSILRKAAARSIAALWEVISSCLKVFSPRECGDDLAQDGIDDVFDITLVKVRVLRSNTLNEL